MYDSTLLTWPAAIAYPYAARLWAAAHSMSCRAGKHV